MMHIALFGAMTLVTASAALPALASNAGPYLLATGTSSQTYVDFSTRVVSYSFTLGTGASHDVFIRDVGRSVPGLQLLIPSGWRDARMIAPHTSIRVTLRFHVSHCNLVPSGTWPLTLEASWGDREWRVINVQMNNSGSDSLEWQQSIADSVCHNTQDADRRSTTNAGVRSLTDRSLIDIVKL
jgi:hypothetical protein